MESVEVTILFRGVGKGPPESRVQNFSGCYYTNRSKQWFSRQLLEGTHSTVTLAIVLLATFPVVSTRICSTHLVRLSVLMNIIVIYRRITLMPRKLLLPILIACGSDRGPKNLCQGCSFIRSRPVWCWVVKRCSVIVFGHYLIIPLYIPYRGIYSPQSFFHRLRDILVYFQ